MPTCDCQHSIVCFTRIRDDIKPLDYGDASGNLIDPEWLTITHNQLGVNCHGGSEGYSMEYRRDDGSVITWEEFRTNEHAIETALRWHSISPSEWHTCMVSDSENARPWLTEPLQ